LHARFNSPAQFLGKSKNCRLLPTLVSWQKIRNELIEAAKSLSSIDNEFQHLTNGNTRLNNELLSCGKDVQLLQEQKTRLEGMQNRSAEILLERNNRITELSNQLKANHNPRVSQSNFQLKN
jgi:predicted nuclease with TOPRIM domain